MTATDSTFLAYFKSIASASAYGEKQSAYLSQPKDSWDKDHQFSLSCPNGHGLLEPETQNNINSIDLYVWFAERSTVWSEEFLELKRGLVSQKQRDWSSNKFGEIKVSVLRKRLIGISSELTLTVQVALIKRLCNQTPIWIQLPSNCDIR